MKIFDISAEISDIDNNRSEIGHGNSFEGKIAGNLKISSIYRYRTEFMRNFICGKHTRVGDLLFQNIEDISKISEIYRKYR